IAALTLRPRRGTLVPVGEEHRMLRVLGFVFLALVALAPSRLPAQEQSAYARKDSALARNGMVVAQEARAARIGRDVLERGGNAVDAAVAVRLALPLPPPPARQLRRRRLPVG